jgi:hypothetical protein
MPLSKRWALELLAWQPPGSRKKAMHIIEAANMRGLSILSNGAQIYNGLTGEMVIERTLQKDVASSMKMTVLRQ